MRAGLLKFEIELWSGTPSKNDAGDRVIAYSKSYTIHAHIKPMKPKEYYEADQLVNEIETQFIVRYNSAIRTLDTANLVLFEPQMEYWYDITAPIQPGYGRKTLVITGRLREHPPEVLS